MKKLSSPGAIPIVDFLLHDFGRCVKKKPVSRLLFVLVRGEPRESEIAVVRAASQRLCPFQVDASRCIGVEIKPTNVRQDLFISMASREFAKAASFVVDAEFKVVTRARLDEIVDEIFRRLFLMAFCSLLAQQSLIL